MQVFCQNCDWSGDIATAKMADIPDKWYDHLMPGDIIPHGWCPECGAACHPKEEVKHSISSATLFAGLYADQAGRVIGMSSPVAAWFTRTAKAINPAFDWSAVGPDLARALRVIENMDCGDGGPSDMKEALDLAYDTAQLTLVNAEIPDEVFETVTLHHKDGATEEIGKGLAFERVPLKEGTLSDAANKIKNEGPERIIPVSKQIFPEPSDPLTRIAEALERLTATGFSVEVFEPHLKSAGQRASEFVRSRPKFAQEEALEQKERAPHGHGHPDDVTKR